MPIKLTLNIDNTADLMGTAAYGTAAVAVIERGTAADDPSFAAAGTAVLTSGVDQVEWWDSSGTSSSWYRFRLFDGSSLYSAYSDSFRATALAAYATLDDLLERLDMPDESRYNLLVDLLEAASAQLEAETGRRFYRVPQVSGTTSRTYDGSGGYVLWEPDGIVSVTTVEVATSGTGGGYTTLGTAEYRLRPAYPEPGWPYTQLVLTDVATTAYPSGYDTVRLTGVFGWSTVPGLVREAVLQMAQKMYNQSQTIDSGIVGPPEMGTMSLAGQRPDAWYRAIRMYGRRAGVAV